MGQVVLVRVLRRNRISRIYIQRGGVGSRGGGERERDYFKELAPEVVGLDRLKSAGQAGRLDIPAGVDVAVVSPKAVWRQNSFLFWELILR